LDLFGSLTNSVVVPAKLAVQKIVINEKNNKKSMNYFALSASVENNPDVII